MSTETSTSASEGGRPEDAEPEGRHAEPDDGTAPAEDTAEPSRTSVASTEQESIDHADADPWHRFATAAEDDSASVPTSRPRRILRRAWYVVRHEWTIAAAVSIALAVAMTWPVLADPANTVPHDTGDPLLLAYLIGWGGHALLTDPASLYTLNAFFGEQYSYAYTDTLLGFAPAGMIGEGVAAAILRYNILYVLSVALVVFGTYALVRQLGSRIPGAAVAAVALAFAPWRLAQAGHLQVVAVGGIMLSLAMLARGHGWSLTRGYRIRRTRWGWVAAGWATATWQVSIGFGMGIPFGYLLGGVVLASVVWWAARRGRNRVPRSVLIADGVGGVLFAGLSLLQALPYLKVVELYPYARRDLEYVDLFSPSWLSLLTAPPESWLWGEAHTPARDTMFWPAESTLLVGFTLIGFALVGLVYSSWSVRQRIFLAAGAAVAVALTMGTNFLDDGEWTYALLFEYLPGFDALRVPGRLILYVTLLLAILAAGGISGLGDRLHEMAEQRRVDLRVPVRRSVPARVALFLPVLLILAEGVSVAETPAVPRPPVALSAVSAPILVLPSSSVDDSRVMLWSSDGYPDVANGSGAFVPSGQDFIRQTAVSFPSPEAVTALRQEGIRTVIVLRSQIPGTSWQHVLDVPPSDTTVKVTENGDAVIFSLS